MNYKTPDELVLAVIKRIDRCRAKTNGFGDKLHVYVASVFGCSEQQAVGLCVSYGFDPDVKVWNPFRRGALE